MFGHSWRVGRLGGVEIRIDASWSVIALLIAYSLFVQFTFAYRSLSDPAAIGLSVLATLLLFGSVLAHEMTHALVARRLGITVDGITLFVFGGVTKADVESRGPAQEFIVSVLGPISSLVIGGLFWALAVLGEHVVAHPVAGALGYLGWVNLFLAGFNLLPGLPLDGGRVLRSAVWAVTRDPRRSTHVASLSGQLIGFAMIALGFVLVFGGALWGGVWLAAIGWFLAQAARVEYHHFELRRLLAGVEADRVMERDVASIPSDASLREAVDEYLLRHDQEVFPVEDAGRTVGVLTAAVVHGVPRTDWDAIRVRESMLPLDPKRIIGIHTSMEEVLQRLGTGTGFLLVESNGKLIGVLTVEDLSRWLRHRGALAG